jgi:hypothetical protein
MSTLVKLLNFPSSNLIIQSQNMFQICIGDSLGDDPLCCPLSHSQGNPVGDSLSCSVGCFLNNPLSCFLSDSRGSLLSNLGSNSRSNLGGDSIGYSLNRSQGCPVGNTPSLLLNRDNLNYNDKLKDFLT